MEADAVAEAPLGNFGIVVRSREDGRDPEEAVGRCGAW